MSCNIPVAVTFDGFILCGAEIGKREQLYIKYKTVKYQHKSLIKKGFIMSFFVLYMCPNQHCVIHQSWKHFFPTVQI